MKIECKVKEELKKEGKTVIWLAKKINMSRSQVSDIINNRYDDVKLSNAFKIANELDKPIDDLWEVIEE